MVKKYLDFMDNLPKVVKVICCFWVLDVLWAVYRICVGVKAKDLVKIVLAIIWILASLTIGWILDIIWIVLYDRIFWFKN